MSSTTALRIYSAAFPTITVNDLRYVLYKATAPTAEVDSQQFAAPHPERRVTFDGLVRANYIWKLLEVLPGTTTVVKQKASFNVVPDSNEIQIKDDVLIEVDQDAGWVNTATSAVMDGTGGKQDWRGWDIHIERIGQGTMKIAKDYTWNMTTGEFDLLAVGDALQPHEYFFIEFLPKLQQGSTGTGGGTINPAMAVKIVTEDDDILVEDIGKKIIIKGIVPALNITLPDIATVAENVITRIESGIGAHVNAKLTPYAGQSFDFGKGNLAAIYFGVCEWMNIYRNGAQWRVDSYDGNFLTVGRIINTDLLAAGEYNILPMDGSDIDVNNNARLYDFVQRLPLAQIVNYADWNTGDNKYKYSYASGSVFKVPDRRDLFQRNTSAGRAAGVYQTDQIKSHVHPIKPPDSDNQNGYGKTTTGNAGTEATGIVQYNSMANTDGGTETNPKNYTINQYILT